MTDISSSKTREVATPHESKKSPAFASVLKIDFNAIRKMIIPR